VRRYDEMLQNFFGDFTYLEVERYERVNRDGLGSCLFFVICVGVCRQMGSYMKRNG